MMDEVGEARAACLLVHEDVWVGCVVSEQTHLLPEGKDLRRSPSAWCPAAFMIGRPIPSDERQIAGGIDNELVDHNDVPLLALALGAGRGPVLAVGAENRKRVAPIQLQAGSALAN